MEIVTSPTALPVTNAAVHTTPRQVVAKVVGNVAVVVKVLVLPEKVIVPV
jgi:hypothetical protein